MASLRYAWTSKSRGDTSLSEQLLAFVIPPDTHACTPTVSPAGSLFLPTHGDDIRDAVHCALGASV